MTEALQEGEVDAILSTSLRKTRNEKTLDTMLLQLHFSGGEEGGQLEVQVIPAVQAGYRTVYASEESEQRRIYDFLESISVNVEISDDGIVSEAK